MAISLVPAQASPKIQAPYVSVVVPVRNEALVIRRTLLQLLEQDYPANRFEIIVLDGESTDDTAGIVRDLQGQHSNIRLLANPKQWSSAGRNIGVQASRGDYLVIVDGHCNLANPHYLTDLATTFVRTGADCVGRPQPLDAPGMSLRQRAIAAARTSWLGHHPASYLYASGEQYVPPQSVAVAYRSSVFAKIGLFDESFDACEDVEFNHRVDRAGLACFFSPALRVAYRPRATLCGLCQQMIRYGRGRVRLVRKHPDTFNWFAFLPGLFLACVVGGAVAVHFWPVLALAYAAGLGGYVLAVLGTAAFIGWKARDARLMLWLPAVFIAIHGGAGLGIVMELILGSGRRPREAVVPLHPGREAK
jgi:glycosyltransferase involved in cell wall biosynthesis